MESVKLSSSSSVQQKSVLLTKQQHEQVKNFSSRRLSCCKTTALVAATHNKELQEDYYPSSSDQLYPFTWESQPGTPKVKIHHNSKLPPLTPPPSYFSTTTTPTRSKNPNPKPAGGFLRSIIPRRLRKPVSPEYSPSSSSSSSSSSPWPSSTRSVPASPAATPLNHHQYCRERVLSNFLHVVEHDEGESGRIDPVCFGLSRGGGSNPRSGGCYLGMIKLFHGRLPS